MPAHSNVTSAPAPSVSSRMASRTSISVGSSTWSAPATVAFALRAAAGSTTMTCPAPVAFSAAAVTSPIGPAPNTTAVPPGFRSGQPYRVVGDGQRLDERADVRRQVAERVDPRLVDDRTSRRSRPGSRQPDEPELAADVVAPGRARRALPADVVRLDGDPVALRHAGHARADARHDARELVPDDNGGQLRAGERVWDPLGGMKIGPSRNSCRSVPQMPHQSTAICTCPGPGGRLGYVVDPDVAVAVEARSLHRDLLDLRDEQPLPCGCREHARARRARGVRRARA